MAKFQYIDSVNITVARKIASAMFGKLNVLYVKKDDINWTFDIWLIPDADVSQDDVDYFYECFQGRGRGQYIVHRSVANNGDTEN